MIAALPMYERPETAAAHDDYWKAIRDALREAGIDAPERLVRGADSWDVWLNRDLCLAQTCGMPYRTRLYCRVNLVATPDFALPGCAPGQYYSVLVARADDRRTLTELAAGHMAVNDALSQSGWAGPMVHLAAEGLRPDDILHTGSHRDSALAVAEGNADLAGIDAQSWRLIRRHDGWAAGLAERARTVPRPGLPYITSARNDPAPIRAALERAVSALAPETRATLDLAGIAYIPASEYLAVPNP